MRAKHLALLSITMVLTAGQAASRGDTPDGLTGSAPGASDIQFKKIVLDTTLRSEGVAVADVDKDGDVDVLAGEVWYEAPDWRMHEIVQPGTYDGSTGYSNTFACFTDDISGDGHVDLICIAFPGMPCYWYENPAGGEGHWKQHPIWHSACNETPTYKDLLGNGKRQLIMAWQPEGEQDEGIMAYFIPRASGLWEEHSISPRQAPGTNRYSHGLGIGDVNGDGHNDVIIKEGWWQGPSSSQAGQWQFHPSPFGEDCADMFAYDVNGDGLNDIISSSAHSYGIWWFEQSKSGQGETKWERHLIDDSFSQTHALHLVDMNGDGLKDLVTGKRYFAHQGHDPGGKEPVVMYWFQLDRSGSEPHFVRHPIVMDVGIGTQFVVDDINGDHKYDIVVSNKKGVHVVEQQ